MVQTRVILPRVHACDCDKYDKWQFAFSVQLFGAAVTQNIAQNAPSALLDIGTANRTNVKDLYRQKTKHSLTKY